MVNLLVKCVETMFAEEVGIEESLMDKNARVVPGIKKKKNVTFGEGEGRKEEKTSKICTDYYFGDMVTWMIVIIFSLH